MKKPAVRAIDVAEYVLQKQGKMPCLKLQKLLYYAQAWSLVWDDRPLFRDRIEAWVGGPVVAAVYAKHRQQFEVSPGAFNGDPDRLDKDAYETVDAVLDFYGNRSGHYLSELTHAEKPWQEAREGLSPGERGSREISLLSMQEYYSGIGGNGDEEAKVRRAGRSAKAAARSSRR